MKACYKKLFTAIFSDPNDTKNRKNVKFLPPSKGESSTKDKESELVEDKKSRGKKRRKLQQSESSSRKGKCIRRKASINILESPKDMHQISETFKASLEDAGTFTTSAEHWQLSIYDTEHPQES
ncbi:hypothetical protein F8M41_015389 [Gigaspora margarita]|uniref:Uncharacterized protein n=1 Tax=Gigaspora margarita TaxID=4874 RepID=A0A8H3WU73_GIGMA|nr:hypothetical protein F8M41_015389 [Gigaspora margarita]